MADAPLRVAIVGLGWWGCQIVDSLSGSEVITVVRAVDPRTDQVASFAANRGLVLSAEMADALEDPDVDGVIIATPHLLHEQQVMAAAGAGKHVFCEKPLALEAAAARRMLAACRDRGLALGIGHERRFEGALEDLARMAVSGELGTVLHLECNWSHNLFAGSIPSGWRQDPQQAPAGTLTALGVHITDFFQSVAGPVSELLAMTGHRSDTFPGEDVLTVQLRFRSGVTGTICNLATTPFHSRIAAFGDRGWVEAREFSNVDIPEPALLSRRGVDNEIHSRTYAHSNTVRANLDQWASSALGIGDYRFTDEQLVHNVEIIEAIVRSSRSGRIEQVGA